MEIRKVRAADLPAVLEMVRGLARHHGDVPTVTLQALERDLFGDAPWMDVLVAQVGMQVVGYAGLCRLGQLQYGVRGLDMHHLFVDAAHRRAGVGTGLIAASVAEAEAQGCRYLMVGTHPQNTAAQDMYLAAGFDRIDAAGPRFRIKL